MQTRRRALDEDGFDVILLARIEQAIKKDFIAAASGELVSTEMSSIRNQAFHRVLNAHAKEMGILKTDFMCEQYARKIRQRELQRFGQLR